MIFQEKEMYFHKKSKKIIEINVIKINNIISFFLNLEKQIHLVLSKI